METINPRRLQPGALTQLLNSAGQGEVINDRQLRRHRNRAGYTIGDGRTVDLFRYAAWLTLEYFKPKEEALSYDEVKRRQAERNADLVRTAQDIAASAERSRDLLENIMVWLETNPPLSEDFPEVCYPIRCLERITNRQKGQKYHGEPTRIEWTSDKIVLPTIAGSRASGVVVSCSGMKGSDIRGQNQARADGRVVRPQLVLVDDPQTTESAWSPSQSERREAILAGDVLGMAGPGKKIAGLNRYIFETVVQALHRVKKNRQIILNTHNPNIPVLGEASAVYVLTSDGERSRVANRGSVDDCKEEIINLLEGGKEAFVRRKDRYNY
jgi:hypothetical protein